MHKGRKPQLDYTKPIAQGLAVGALLGVYAYAFAPVLIEALRYYVAGH